MITNNILYVPKLNPIRLSNSPLDTEPVHQFAPSDITMLQLVNTGTPYAITASLYSSTGALVTNFEVTSSVLASVYNFYSVQLRLPSEEGCYRLEIEAVSESEVFLYANIEIAEANKALTTLHYWNSYNDFDVNFADGLVFMLRTPGGFLDKAYQPKRQDQIYQDQEVSWKLLKSRPYNTMMFTAGYDVGIADYLIDIINMAWGCDNVYVNGQGYIVYEGAEWSATEEEAYPLRTWTIEVVGTGAEYSLEGEVYIEIGWKEHICHEINTGEANSLSVEEVDTGLQNRLYPTVYGVANTNDGTMYAIGAGTIDDGIIYASEQGSTNVRIATNNASKSSISLIYHNRQTDELFVAASFSLAKLSAPYVFDSIGGASVPTFYAAADVGARTYFLSRTALYVWTGSVLSNMFTLPVPINSSTGYSMTCDNDYAYFLNGNVVYRVFETSTVTPYKEFPDANVTLYHDENNVAYAYHGGALYRLTGGVTQLVGTLPERPSTIPGRTFPVFNGTPYFVTGASNGSNLYAIQGNALKVVSPLRAGGTNTAFMSDGKLILLSGERLSEFDGTKVIESDAKTYSITGTTKYADNNWINSANAYNGTVRQLIVSAGSASEVWETDGWAVATRAEVTRHSSNGGSEIKSYYITDAFGIYAAISPTEYSRIDFSALASRQEAFVNYIKGLYPEAGKAIEDFYSFVILSPNCKAPAPIGYTFTADPTTIEFPPNGGQIPITVASRLGDAAYPYTIQAVPDWAKITITPTGVIVSVDPEDEELTGTIKFVQQRETEMVTIVVNLHKDGVSISSEWSNPICRII